MPTKNMVNVQVRGLEQVQAFLKTVPRGTIKPAVKAITEYIVGLPNGKHGLMHYPPKKYVSRKSAYGRTFQSDKQRRWFFANLHEGRLQIPYIRTGKLASGWNIVGDDYRKRITNRIPYAAHVVADGTQARQPAKVGWRTVSKNIADNIKGALRAGDTAVAKWIKEHNR